MDTIFRRQAGGLSVNRILLVAMIVFSLTVTSTSCRAQTKALMSTIAEGDICDGCQAMFENMPQQLDWQTTIAPAAEPGEKMEISGVIYRVDGKTPAPGVILYVYHTDAKGIYDPAPGATGAARNHGHLRGWVKTNQRGEYKFFSIRPAQYPNRRNPAHIHPIIKEPDKNAYWIDEYLFDDDPSVIREPPPKTGNRGGSGVIHLAKNAKGTWIGRRDITLGLNIPNYK